MELLLPAGKRIRHLRETRKHYSQAGLAEAASCSPGTIMRVEKGLATNQGTLERIAKALNVSLIEITRNKDWTRRLLSNPQMVAILDRIRTSEMETVTAGRPGRRALPMDERGQGVLALLMSLGVIKIEGREPCSVSELADAFLASLRAHLRDGGRHYPGQWNAGTTSAAGRRLVSLIRGCEEYRIQTMPTPARQIQAALGLVRADYGKEPRFLMLQEPTWAPQGAWWFVGGLEKVCDGGNPARTMLREIREELALEETDSVKVQSLGEVMDLRISGRLGVFTNYKYHLFQVQGEECPGLRRLLVPNPTVEVYAPRSPSFLRIHKLRWFSWSELLKLDHLAKNAGPVLSLLTGIDPLQVPSIGRLPREQQASSSA